MFFFYKTVQYGLCNHNKFVTPGCPEGLHIFEAGVKNVIHGYISNDAAAKIIRIVRLRPPGILHRRITCADTSLVANGTSECLCLLVTKLQAYELSSQHSF